jgi:uncharacterized membrane-anchored protein
MRSLRLTPIWVCSRKERREQDDPFAFSGDFRSAAFVNALTPLPPSPASHLISFMRDSDGGSTAKVPAVTLFFWVIKILATTLGETGGDTLSMSLHLGYLVSTAIFGLAFVALVALQIRARCFQPMLYWVTIIATTTVGTTLADYADRSLGIGYAGGVTLLGGLLIASLLAWRRSEGSVAVASVSSPRAEAFYWITIMASQTLGTALGDWTADSEGFGYSGGVVLFGGLLAACALLYFVPRVSRTALFWAAFVLTRPLGAVVGDLLDKPVSEGGLALSRAAASAVLCGAIALAVIFLPQRAATMHPSAAR